MSDVNSDLAESLVTFMRAKASLEEKLGKKFNHFGELGELLAANQYAIELHKRSNEKTTDGMDEQGRLWQIKCCFTEDRDNSNFPVESTPGMGYLALKIHPDGAIEEVYNGPWTEVNEKIRDNAEFPKSAIAYHSCKISNKKLGDLNEQVSSEFKLKKRA